MKLDMATATTNDLVAFRSTTHEWLKANCPPVMRKPATSEADICSGGAPIHFPERGLSTVDVADDGARIDGIHLTQGIRLWRSYARRGCGVTARNGRAGLPCTPQNNGIWMFGATLLKYDSDAQKRVHLPPVARGEIRWAQGYSEPGAASDLASLATRALA